MHYYFSLDDLLVKTRTNICTGGMHCLERRPVHGGHYSFYFKNDALKAKRIGVFLLDQEGPIHRARSAYKVLLLEVAPSWDSLVPPGPAPTAPVFLDLPEVGLPQAGEVVLRGVLDSDICIVHKLYISFKRSFANNSIQYRIGMEGVYYMGDSPPTIALLEELATYAGTRFANLSHWHMICFMRFFYLFYILACRTSPPYPW